MYLTEVLNTSQFLKNDRHAYEILANLSNEEVPLNIDRGKLKTLYRQISRQLHPDINPNEEDIQFGDARLKKIDAGETQ